MFILVLIELDRTMFDNAGSREKKWCEVQGSGHNDLQIFKGAALDCLESFLKTTPHLDSK
ncbi:MAG: hypothetical protein AAB089_03295 [Nitrospirota bacterium]